MTTHLLTVRDLSVSYGDRRVSFVPELTVGAGECVAIVGESGSGKTSALLALLGLHPGARVSGVVDMFGTEDVLAERSRLTGLLGRRVALISQSPISALNPTMRLGRFAEVVLRKHGRSRAEARAQITAALSAVSLAPDILTRYPHQVSGGQAQRFAIALAVELIVADEPTSALDVTVQAEIVALLASLRRDRGMGLLIVSHDIALVSGLADRIIVMKDGEVVEAGPTRSVIGNPTTDYARALIGAVPQIGGSTS
ncbi:ABC transporter ATP-binding protein [Cryobacterium tagatosivorans]|uniref:ABC transporter ATP-binding protein n=1 Tax=Cryobacterium tagatosivorans TaxID=1259199 RepID=A0A4R8UKT3_9MICO|nr:ABC transporter ATP-binding protein [Cryobacterium tagatosivorans]TFB56376.1 ABC transporter ATP-binding protein [Cryobacterium tagatosivorans]